MLRIKSTIYLTGQVNNNNSNTKSQTSFDHLILRFVDLRPCEWFPAEIFFLVNLRNG